MSNTSRTASAQGSGNRRIRVAASVVVALGACLGYAYAVPAAAGTPATPIPAKATAISAITETCPIVTGTKDADVAAYDPALPGAAAGEAIVVQQNTTDPLVDTTKPGTYFYAGSLSGDVTDLDIDSFPLTGRAAGGLAPGYTTDAALESGNSGTGEYGLAAAACAQPDTGFWFIGAGTETTPVVQLGLVDTDDLTAQVNLAEYGPNGLMSGAAQDANEGLVVQTHNQASPPGQLIDPANPPGAIALHVIATTGRVTAGMLAGDGKGGGRDFIQAQTPASTLVIPGIPAPPAGTTMKLQLMLMATTQDADVTMKWVGNSSFTPSVTVPHLSAGHVQSVDISAIPSAGENGALEIDSTGGTPIIGAIKVTESKGGSSDTAYLTPVPALTGDSVVAMNRAGSSVILTDENAKPAQVRIATTTQSGSNAPNTTTQTVTVPGKATVATALTAPPGAAQFAITVTPLDGAAQVYAARVMTGDAPLLTIQPMYSALESVQIPPVRADMSGTVPQN
ncbi:MAG TPA: DUF5719 family protein [Actinocrinis sp.]|nr:DUF5719 family protein [Actinocrinis sp.]